MSRGSRWPLGWSAGLALALVILAGLAAPALAQGALAGSRTPPPAAEAEAGEAMPAGDEAEEASPGARAKKPADGAPYNIRQMIFAAGIMAVMLAFLVWLIRRQKRSASARSP